MKKSDNSGSVLISAGFETREDPWLAKDVLKQGLLDV